MAYKIRNKKRSVVRTYKKRISVKKTVKNNKSLIQLIKKVALKPVETKYSHLTAENVNINHNSGYIYTNLLKTTQGITDTGTGISAYSNRIGDQVIARGISIKLWIANKLDRPNIMYRLVVFKYQSLNIPLITTCFKGAIGNKMMDDLDKEFITPVYQKIFNLQVGYSAYATATAGDTDGREAHTYKQIWVPLKNKQVHYADGSSAPKFFDYGFFIIPYDSYGSLTTDNIASFSYEQKFYFKDP